MALVLTAQYTNEEYETVLNAFTNALGALPKVYVWRDASENVEAFDGILLRGDRNPNTQGLKDVLAKHGVTPELLCKDWSKLGAQAASHAFVFGPEVN